MHLHRLVGDCLRRKKTMTKEKNGAEYENGAEHFCSFKVRSVMMQSQCKAVHFICFIVQ